MAFGLELGIDQRSIHTDLEAAPVRRNDRHRFNDMLKLLEQILFQAHGPVGVVSNRAVDDLDFEHFCTSMGFLVGRSEAFRIFSRQFLRYATVQSQIQMLENYNMLRLSLGTL